MQTEVGMQQAKNAGQRISEIFHSGESFFVYVSPYDRSKQTLAGIMSEIDSSRIAGIQEEVQLREQDFGNFQVTAVV